VIVASTGGEILEVIGDGEIGLKDGDFETARVFRPQGLTFDAARNALYIADMENHAVRKVDLAAKRVTTLAGNGKQLVTYPPRGGVGTDAELSSPWDVILIGKDDLYIAMAGTHQLWRLALDTNRATPYAGSARENIVDGPLKDAALAQPSGLATDGKKLFFADSEVSAVRSADLSATGSVETLIGKGLFEFGDIDGKYPEARLQHPIGVAYHDGFVYVADTYNHKIKRVNPETKTLETFIGTGKRGMTDGPARQASLSEPNGMVFVGSKLYIADTNNHMIRVFDKATGAVSTLKISGIEKLAKKTMPGFKPGEKVLASQSISPGTGSLELTINLPRGTKFNRAAPFRIQAKSSKPESVAIGEFKITDPSNKLTVPLIPKEGEASIAVELMINYCSVGNEGLCYFKETRLVIPVKVTAGAGKTVSAVYSL
jgi:DNA-binding beta-propeller fold protein YncE